MNVLGTHSNIPIQALLRTNRHGNTGSIAYRVELVTWYSQNTNPIHAIPESTRRTITMGDDQSDRPSPACRIAVMSRTVAARSNITPAPSTLFHDSLESSFFHVDFRGSDWRE
jgi:hypothetical protein